MTGPSADELGRLFAKAEESFERASLSARRTDVAIARADSIMARNSGRDNAARAAARRERRRLNAGLGRMVKRVLAVVLALWVATIIFGFFQPIGLFGLLAVILAGGLLVALTVSVSRNPRPEPRLKPNAPAGELVDRLDSYLYRARAALPSPAQSEVDAMLAALPALKPSLERAPALDPAAEDARRLMSNHLPGLIDRYLAVPDAYRSNRDGDDPSVDDRLIEALRAGRGALDDIGQRLARDNVAAFETQGRFIESKYREEPIDR